MNLFWILFSFSLLLRSEQSCGLLMSHFISIPIEKLFIRWKCHNFHYAVSLCYWHRSFACFDININTTLQNHRSVKLHFIKYYRGIYEHIYSILHKWMITKRIIIVVILYYYFIYIFLFWVVCSCLLIAHNTNFELLWILYYICMYLSPWSPIESHQKEKLQRKNHICEKLGVSLSHARAHLLVGCLQASHHSICMLTIICSLFHADFFALIIHFGKRIDFFLCEPVIHIQIVRIDHFVRPFVLDQCAIEAMHVAFQMQIWLR